MKKALSVICFVLAIVWFLMVAFKIYLGVTGFVDFNGRGPSDHYLSAFLQFLLVVAALALGVWLRKKPTL